jgi:hypothetical protein
LKGRSRSRPWFPWLSSRRLLRRVRELTGKALAELVADTGYAGGADLREAAQAGVAVYAPWPQPPAGGGKYLPKSAFVWQAAERAYVCPQG